MCSNRNDKYSEIKDQIECRKAFAFAWQQYFRRNNDPMVCNPPLRDVTFGLWNNFNSPDFPSGCFIDVTNNISYTVYFNDNTKGSANANARPICVRGEMFHLKFILNMFNPKYVIVLAVRLRILFVIFCHVIINSDRQNCTTHEDCTENTDYLCDVDEICKGN